MALGIAQVALGAFCVAVGIGNLGVGLIMEGMQDLYKSIQIIQGGQFSWDNYFIDKGVSIAASLAIKGIETIVTSSKGAKILAKEAIIKANVLKLMGKELAVQTIKEVAIKTVVNIGMDTMVNIISRKTLREFKDDVTDNVSKKISQCFNQQSVQQQLTHILAIDGFNYNSNYQEIINKIINDILSNKRNAITDIASKTIDAMTHSSNTAVKALGYISKGGKIANDLSKIQDFIDNFCDDLIDRLNHLKQRLPKLSDLLYQHMKPKLNRQDIDGIIQKLTQGSIVQNDQLVLTAICAIDVIRFGEYEEHKTKVVELCKRLHAYFTTNYSNAINLLCQETTHKVTGQLMGNIQGQLICPVVKEGTDRVSKTVSDKLIEALNQMNRTLQETPNKQKLEIVASDNKELPEDNNIVQKNKQLRSDKAEDNTNPVSKNHVTKLKNERISSSSSNQQDVNKPVSRADQNKQDEAKSTTNDDDKPFNYFMLFFEKPETEQLKLSPENIIPQVPNFTEKDKMLQIYNDISSLIKDRPAGTQDNMTRFLLDFLNSSMVNYSFTNNLNNLFNATQQQTLSQTDWLEANIGTKQTSWHAEVNQTKLPQAAYNRIYGSEMANRLESCTKNESMYNKIQQRLQESAVGINVIENETYTQQDIKFGREHPRTAMIGHGLNILVPLAIAFGPTVAIASASLSETGSILSTEGRVLYSTLTSSNVARTGVLAFERTATGGAVTYSGGGVATVTMPSSLYYAPLFAAGIYGAGMTTNSGTGGSGNLSNWWDNFAFKPTNAYDETKPLPIYDTSNSAVSLIGSRYNFGNIGAGSLFDIDPNADKPRSNITLPSPIKTSATTVKPDDRERNIDLIKDHGFVYADPELAKAPSTALPPTTSHWSDHVYDIYNRYGDDSNVLSEQQQIEFEKRKHDDRGKSSATSQQQKATTSNTLIPMHDPDDFEPDDDKFRKEQYKLDQKARKFGFSDGKSAYTRQVLDNLDTTVENFISKYRKRSIYREFPGEYLRDKAGNPITIREALKHGGSTVRKLLINKRFSK